MSGVKCHVSGVMCHMSGVVCQVSHIMFFCVCVFFFYKLVEPVEGLLSTGPTLSSFPEKENKKKSKIKNQMAENMKI